MNLWQFAPVLFTVFFFLVLIEILTCSTPVTITEYWSELFHAKAKSSPSGSLLTSERMWVWQCEGAPGVVLWWHCEIQHNRNLSVGVIFWEKHDQFIMKNGEILCTMGCLRDTYLFLLRIILMATSSLFLWSRHFRTCPKEPFPITSSTSNR